FLSAWTPTIRWRAFLLRYNFSSSDWIIRTAMPISSGKLLVRTFSALPRHTCIRKNLSRSLWGIRRKQAKSEDSLRRADGIFERRWRILDPGLQILSISQILHLWESGKNSHPA